LYLERDETPVPLWESVSARERRAYFSALKEWRKKIGALDLAQKTELLRYLEEARKGVVSAIAGAKDFKAYHLKELEREFVGIMDTFNARYGQLMVGAQSAHADAGWNAVMDQIEKIRPDALGKISSIVGLSPDVMEAASLMSADLITEIGAKALTAINREVRFSAMGIKSPWDAMNAIGKNLTDPSVFGSIATRAETILRTETGRIRSQANLAAMDRVKDVVPGVRKQWIWSGIGRAEHAAIDGVTIPVDEDFTDGYGNKGPGPRLFGDPASDVNCGCDIRLVIEEKGEKK
jgi:hypothetical protein